MKIEVSSEDSLYALRTAHAAIGDLIDAVSRSASPDASPAPASPPEPATTRKRRTKAEMQAAAAAAQAPSAPAQEAEDPEPPASTAGDWDEDDEPEAPVKTYTKDDVRAALVALQGRSSQEQAQALLKRVGGVERLGALPESKFAEVIKAAQTAK